MSILDIRNIESKKLPLTVKNKMTPFDPAIPTNLFVNVRRSPAYTYNYVKGIKER